MSPSHRGRPFIEAPTWSTWNTASSPPSPSLRGRPFIEVPSPSRRPAARGGSPSLRGRPFIEARCRCRSAGSARWSPSLRGRPFIEARRGRSAGRGTRYVLEPSGVSSPTRTASSRTPFQSWPLAPALGPLGHGRPANATAPGQLSPGDIADSQVPRPAASGAGAASRQAGHPGACACQERRQSHPGQPAGAARRRPGVPGSADRHHDGAGQAVLHHPGRVCRVRARPHPRAD